MFGDKKLASSTGYREDEFNCIVLILCAITISYIIGYVRALLRFKEAKHILQMETYDVYSAYAYLESLINPSRRA